MKAPLFNEYLFADYSGGGEDRKAQRNIALWTLATNGSPKKLLPLSGAAKNFSRDGLTDFVLNRLTAATRRNRRILFGFDHQYAWPSRLRRHSNVESIDWRTAIRKLSEGDPTTGLPQLDIPKRYCQLFNQFSGQDTFWTPFKGKADAYGITTQKPQDPLRDRFRLAELVKPLQGQARPKPADCVGGTGEGIVGGQTICGLRQLAKMISRTDVAWWPFDGLDIQADFYRGKHVGVEIYPSAFRAGQQRSDDHDAEATCLAVRDADVCGQLIELMQLKIPSTFHEVVLREGWIIGMDPNDIQGALRRSQNLAERKD